MTDGDEHRDELADELAERAAERWMAASGVQREAVLAALVAEHPAHESALRRLCTDLGGAERLLDDTFPATDAETVTHIGAHRVVRRLGEGAFGIVYLCAQEKPVVRHVAIKVLRSGVGDQKTLRRFAAERQLLAALNHPAITQVFDAGELPDGRPFFVMEYVDGQTIRSYCDDRGLSCGERLRLFVELGRGVAHAHSRGIVHRDLKPGNVLVVQTETGPVPKIIDFGIAKALFASDDRTGPRTDAGRVIGTPGYMSPEQAGGRIDEVDQRSDVFALGVMLYELLTGALPWAHGAAATDTEPVRPSARVTTTTRSAADATPPTQRRQLAAALRGDLDWITLNALAREPGDRYATVTALVADLERHLRGETVSVGPPSLTYRLRKLVRRNRTATATLGGAFVILVAGLAVALAYGSDAAAAVVDARKEVAASFADSTALVDRLLARANEPQLREAPQGDATRAALLDDALAFYDRFLVDRPTDPKLRVGRCRALLAISHVHCLLGEPAHAGSAANEAAAEAEALVALDPRSLVHRSLLGDALRRQGSALALAADHTAAQPKFAAAAAQLASCAAEAPAVHGLSHAIALREAAETLGDRASDLRIDGLRQSLRALDALRAQDPPIADLAGDYVTTCSCLAEQLRLARRLDEAEAILTRAGAELVAVTTERSRLAHLVSSLRGKVAFDRGERQGTLVHLQQAVEAATAWQQEQPQRLLPQSQLVRSLRDLGYAQNYAGDFGASSTSLRRAIERADAMVQQSPADPNRLLTLGSVLSEFALTLSDRFRQEDLAEAAACAARATAVDDRLPATAQAGRSPRWQLLAMHAAIEDARVDGNADRLWPEVERALPSDPSTKSLREREALIGAHIGLARWHFARGETEAAARIHAQARELVEASRPAISKLAVEVGWLEARMAAARSDHAAAALAGDWILAARSTWLGRRRAADSWFLAWRCARAAPATATAIVADYHDKAASSYAMVIRTLREDVAKDPQDPWFVLPWGFASVCAAELAAAAGDIGPARELLAAALPQLEAVRAAAHRNQWEEETFRDGRALQQRLSAAQGR